MRKRSVLAFLLAIAMLMSLCSPALAVNTKGVTFTAQLDKSTIEVSSEDQTVTVTVNANQVITWDGIGFKAFYDSPLKLTNITNKEVTLTAGDIQVELGSGDNGAGYQTADGENSTITNICVLHFTVPANTPAGTYNLGVQKLEITSDYGEIWENSATAMTTLTIEEAGAPEAVAYAATPSQSTFNVSSEDQTVTVTVDANQVITWDGIGFKAFYDSPLKLTNITNKEVTLTAGDIQVELGSGDNGAGYQTADGENSTITNICVLHFTIPANTPAGTYNLGIQKLEITSDYGEIWERSATAMTTITLTDAPVHSCTLTPVEGKDATCDVDGWMGYYQCSDQSCGKLYSDANGTDEIPDLDAWKVGDGKIPASHDYGDLIEEDPGKHAADEVKDGMKAHYFCDTCDSYFDDNYTLVEEEDLIIKNEHSFTTVNGYKEEDGHADTCSCGAHDTVEPHEPNIPAATEDEDQICSICEYVLANALGHVHANHLTIVPEESADCTEDGHRAYYECSCGKAFFEDATGSIQIPDLDAWLDGDGKISATGHTYDEKIQDEAHLKDEATNCTEYNTYWYDCSVCDANAKDDEDATDKFWTSDVAGDHVFEEEIEDEDHYVEGTGTCQEGKEYYYDCAYCDEIGEDTWVSDTMGDHSFTEEIEDEDHYVEGTGETCQDYKEYYYDCEYCDEMSEDTWVSETVGDHEYSEDWESNWRKHWNECACGDKANEEAHVDNDGDRKCDVCDYKMGGGAVVPPTPSVPSVPSEPSEPSEPPVDTPPQTGDNSVMWLWIVLLVVSSAGVITTIAYDKKRSVR